MSIEHPISKETIGTWTFESYATYNEALRLADEKFQAERDRRYTEVGVEKEKALKIKEIADLSALELAREGQVYKDERNDQMREASLRNNGIYATRDDLALVFSKSEKALANVVDEMKTVLKPILEHIAEDKGSQLTIGKIFAIIAASGTIIGVIVAIVNYFF